MQAPSSNYKPTTEEIKLIDRLFVRMNSNYGNLWSSRYRSANMLEAAKKEWLFDLRQFKQDCIARALILCKSVHTSSPPTLPEFSLLCSTVRKSELAKLTAIKPQPWKPNRKLAAEQTALAKEKLKGAVIKTDHKYKRTA